MSWPKETRSGWEGPRFWPEVKNRVVAGVRWGIGCVEGPMITAPQASSLFLMMYGFGPEVPSSLVESVYSLKASQSTATKLLIPLPWPHPSALVIRSQGGRESEREEVYKLLGRGPSVGA
ncbi:unnamed protein product [Leuciscus chuanchicus]